MKIYDKDLKAEDAYLLARVSSKEQKAQGNSIPAQIERLRDYINKNEQLSLIEEYAFDESASILERKEFERFLNRIVKSRKTIAICSDKVDRLLRDFPTWLPKLDKLRKKGLIELHFVSDHLIVHQQSTAIDLFQFNMAVALAQYFADSISDNTKRGLEGKILKGEWATGTIPRGYHAIKEVVRGKLRTTDIIPLKEEFKIIQKLFKMYGTGLYSLNQLIDWSFKHNFKSRNDKKASRRLIADILHNPFYYGLMKFKGKLFPHKYQPIITKELFDTVQQQFELKNRNNTKNKQKVLKLFQSLITCKNCGCTITAESKKEGRFILYSCTNYYKNCKKIYVNETHLIEQIESFFHSIKLTDKQIKLVVNQLRILHESHKKFQNQTMKSLQKEHCLIQQHIDSLFDKYTKPNSPISDEMYNSKLITLKERQQAVSTHLESQTDKDEQYHINVRKILSLSQKAHELFMSSETELKRGLINFSLSNLMLDGKKLYFTIRSPFKELVNAKTCNELGQLCNTFRTINLQSISKDLDFLKQNE
ncbi:recombinase family protein [Polaribacter porphyrae]|uniref:Recombinase domain-containing protein n=1 Tax=Polaribacter porphyrae TaxID=1137780 RepID=A0A2S7WSV0_9FLAO|nr:recombinase family protein [Polaribacter porphyrae]PQJ80670.1 hypothetical protein BTO18_16485 [Polaribacter porphyrae]